MVEPINPQQLRTQKMRPDTIRPEKMAFEMPTGNDPVSVRKRIEAMEQLLERSFTIPGVNYPIGLDSIVGLVPIVGDLVTAAMGAYTMNAAILRAMNHPAPEGARVLTPRK